MKLTSFISINSGGMISLSDGSLWRMLAPLPTLRAAQRDLSHLQGAPATVSQKGHADYEMAIEGYGSFKVMPSQRM